MAINKIVLILCLPTLVTACTPQDKQMDCRKMALALATGKEADMRALDVYESQYVFDFRPVNGLKRNSFTSYYEECRQWTR